MEVQLYDIHVNIPSAYNEKGLVVGYRTKSIGDILHDRHMTELAELEYWVICQFMFYLNWPKNLEITKIDIIKALQLMNDLKIKPINCYYAREDDLNYDIEENK
tara:strand:+ start:217 stop:528 length:312 start_codon:yes stop_codon:yes gene_type:complete